MENYTLQPTRNVEGKTRKVGVELEFVGVSLQETANVVATVFNGSVQKCHKQLYTVDTPKYGVFRIELDTRLLGKLNSEIQEKRRQCLKVFVDKSDTVLTTPKVNEIAPFEIVTPPLDVSGLRTLEVVIGVLRRLGAEGTGFTASHAFGLHLNTDLVSINPDYLLSVMQAYALLHDYMVEEMRVDVMRRASQFATPYPETYTELIMQPDYRPNLKELISDYVKHNPTRNRGLDMLPCFAWIDPEAVYSVVKDTLVKARPAFHFRLPNCRIDETGWNIAQELAWWQEVEYLADHQELKNQMAEAYAESAKDPWWHFEQKQWEKEVPQWLRH